MKKQINIFNLSSDELRNIVYKGGEDLTKIRYLFKTGIRKTHREIKRVEYLLENYTNRGVALMTISSLISLLPFGFSDNASEFIVYYMAWIFPFLLFGIFAFTRTIRRGNIYNTRHTTVPKGNQDELLILRMEAESIQEVWQQLHKQHGYILFWYRLSNIAIILFLFWYTLNFYLFVFLKLPDGDTAKWLALLVIACGIIMYNRDKILSYSKEWK